MSRIFFLLMLMFLSNNTFGGERNDLLSFESQYSVKETNKRLVKLLKEKGFTIFNQIDHSLGAKNVNISLADTHVVIFGNPKIGSKLMQCNSTIAIDLPQKALIWQDKKNKVWLSVNNPQYLKKRHKVQGCDPIFTKISAALKAISTKVTNK